MPPKYTLLLLFLTIVFFSGATAAAGFDHGHRAWEALVSRHVVWIEGGKASRVDYAGFQKDRPKLKAYLDSLTAVALKDYEKWTRGQRLAFLINAYNAFTIELILSKYPVSSIKKTVSLFRNPWKQTFFSLLGKKRHLDNIEHDLIRRPGDFDEPRIHFAVVCAAIGCPGIRNEAFTDQKLETQLEDSLKRFLGDRTRNRYNVAQERLEVSKIFQWYGDDFAGQSGNYQSLNHFFAAYADLLTDDAQGQSQVRSGTAAIQFLDYDWSLNDRKSGGTPDS